MQFHNVSLHVLLIKNVIELSVYVHIGCLCGIANTLCLVNGKCTHN